MIQFGQHSGVHGKGERKQLQWYERHSPATKQTQLWILGAYFTYTCFYSPTNFTDPSDKREFEFDESIPLLMKVWLAWRWRDFEDPLDDYFPSLFSKSESRDTLLFPDPMLSLS